MTCECCDTRNWSVDVFIDHTAAPTVVRYVCELCRSSGVFDEYRRANAFGDGTGAFVGGIATKALACFIGNRILAELAELRAEVKEFREKR
jgi:hypothetical protein